MVDDTIIAGVKMSTEDIMRRFEGAEGFGSESENCAPWSGGNCFLLR